MGLSSSPNRGYSLPGCTVNDKRLTDLTAIKNTLIAIDTDISNILKSSFRANFPGTVTTNVGTNRNYPNSNINIKSITSWVSENLVGNLVIDICKNNVVVQTITMLSGQSKVTNNLITLIPLTSDDFLTVNIVSGTCNDLVIRFDY